jgi:hypothetical protein
MVCDQQNRLVASQMQKMQEKENGCLRSMTNLESAIYRAVLGGSRESVQDAVNQKGLNNEQAGSSFTSSGLTVYYKEDHAISATFSEVLSWSL